MPDPLNVIVDTSHHNGSVNFAKAKTDGILGVIHPSGNPSGCNRRLLFATSLLGFLKLTRGS